MEVKMASKFQAGSIDLMTTLTPAVPGREESGVTHVRFPDPFPQGTKVVVMPMALACEGLQCIEIHIDDVTSSGFKMKVKDPTMTNCKCRFKATVGWLAYEDQPLNH